MRGLLSIILLLIVSCSALADERQLEIIPLEHRLVNDILPIVQPLVEPGGTVTGMNNQLIIKSSPANIAEIKQVLASVDRAPRQLMITVKQNQSLNEQRNAAGVSGRYGKGDITVETDGSLRREDLLAEIEDREGNRLKYELQSQSGSNDDHNTYRVQATEGYPAHIQAGASVPFPSRNVYVAPGNVIVQDGYQYEDATSGFYVLPRVQGNTVTLEIAPRTMQIQTGHGPPVIRLQDVQTVVSGQLGEWIPLGGINQSASRSDQGVLSRSSSQSSEQSNILIRVDEIRQND